MYSSSNYIPKISNNLLDEPIHTHSGVTQGRKSSCNIFSFLLSDMPKSLQGRQNSDFMDPDCTAQMADDTLSAADKTESLIQKFQCLLNFSEEKLQVLNKEKTLYIHMSETPETSPLHIKDDYYLKSVKLNVIQNNQI